MLENCDIYVNVIFKIFFIFDKVYDLKVSLLNKKDFEVNVDDENFDFYIFDDIDMNLLYFEDNDF